jgi:PTS system mannose-specific IIB component
MANVVLTRIDDRLIHGQVMTAWVKTTKANRIIIVDDVVAKDDFMKKVLSMAAPTGIKVDAFTVEEASTALKEESKEDERIIILVKVPQTVERMLNNGVEIKDIIVGGIGAAPGRKRLYKNISISEEERQSFLNILDMGTEVNVRIVPDDRPQPIKSCL